MSTKTLAPSKSVTSRDPKGLKFVSIVEAAYNKEGLSEKEAQRVNNAAGLADLIAGFIAQHRSTDRYKKEEVKSSYTYPTSYKLKGVVEQTNILRQYFPGVGFANEKVLDEQLPQHAEGWFAIPKWQTIAPTYGEAVEKVFAAIARQRKFTNYREGQLGPKNLRQSAQSAAAFEKLADEQKGYDILVVAAQFGLRHRGRSVRRALEVMIDAENEFGLGAFAVGIMILTHPERFEKYEDLCIDCAGDEASLGGAGDFSRAPDFEWDDGELSFDVGWTDSVYDCFGSASGFLPQQ